MPYGLRVCRELVRLLTRRRLKRNTLTYSPACVPRLSSRPPAVVFRVHYQELMTRNEEIERLKAVIEGVPGGNGGEQGGGVGP